MKKALIWIFAIFGLLIMLAVYSRAKNESEIAAKSDVITEKAFTQPVIVNVRELADSFDDNQVAAEAYWGGKLVQFSAKVSNIKDSGISFYDVASKEFSLTSIGCFTQNKQQLMNIKKGQVITVRGTIRSDQILGFIGMDDCVLVSY